MVKGDLREADEDSLKDVKTRNELRISGLAQAGVYRIGTEIVGSDFRDLCPALFNKFVVFLDGWILTKRGRRSECLAECLTLKILLECGNLLKKAMKTVESLLL
ncbi:hypothetical protein R1flu_027746 [Riccia fluitans]|uniref:Uncharacterized protein n=1 Tax=Riccia fluitans TaxID=41844 RepID=A0ABD1XJP0_9MARC